MTPAGERNRKAMKADAVITVNDPDDLGERVDKVTIRRGSHERTRLEVYAKRRSMHGTLDGNGVEEVERWEKIDELSEQASTEVLFGLAEAFGYDLEAR
jgi:hypothetical protein